MADTGSRRPKGLACRPGTWSSFWILAFWTDENEKARPGGDFAHLHVAPFQRGPEEVLHEETPSC